jgi:hypothetical protein
VEGERRRLIHPELTRRLREIAGTGFAEAAMSRELSPGFSRATLVSELAELGALFPPSPLRDRIFGEPGFLKKGASETRTREWEISREAIVEAFRALRASGVDLAREKENLRMSFAHSDGTAVAIAVSAGEKAEFGIDLEPEARAISDAAFSRFFRPEEGAFLKARLDHWVLKEACYKAHPRAGTTIVADYVVTGGDPEKLDFKVLCTKGAPEKFRGIVDSVEGYRYALATRVSIG